VLAGSKDPNHNTSLFATVAGRSAAGVAGSVIRKINSGTVGISSRPCPTFKRVFLRVVLALETRLKQGCRDYWVSENFISPLTVF
jgi:hypothetical protein